MQQLEFYHNLLTAFKYGISATIYTYLLPIANMQFHPDPVIAQIQTDCYNEFMRLNAILYDAPSTIKAEYPLFNPTQYRNLYTIRQICHKRHKKHKRAIAATLCL